jgi:hypothetical protein
MTIARKERQQRDAVIVESDAGNAEATLQAMAAQIVQYRRALALLGTAIELAQAGAPFALIPPGPLWKPRTSESIDGKAASQ